MCNFWMQCFIKDFFQAAKSFELFQMHMFNVDKVHVKKMVFVYNIFFEGISLLNAYEEYWWCHRSRRVVRIVRTAREITIVNSLWWLPLYRQARKRGIQWINELMNDNGVLGQPQAVLQIIHLVSHHFLPWIYYQAKPKLFEIVIAVIVHALLNHWQC